MCSPSTPTIPAKSVPELIELLKAKPDTYTFASSGVGTSTHLAGELFMAKTGTKMIHVPYKSSGQVMLDVVAGHVDMAFDNIPTVAQQASAGKVRALAVTSLDRAPLMPDIPPMADFMPGFEATSWHGLFAPAGTPPEIVDKISAEVQRIMQRARDAGAPAENGRQADRQHAGRVRPVHRGRAREVGEGSEDYAEEILKQPNPLGPIAQRFQGGSFVAQDFTPMDQRPC